MYLIEFNELGKISKITPNPERGLGGTYYNKLPISIEQLLLDNLIEEHLDTQNKKYYIIKGEN